MRVLFLVCLIVFITLSSCRKFKDTPKYAFLSKNQRIGKEWRLISQSENLMAVDLTGLTIQLDLHQDNSYISSTSCLLFGQVVRTEKKGNWNFSADSKALILNELGTHKVERYTIVMLKKGELQLQQIIPYDQRSTTKTIKQFVFKSN